MRTTSKCTERGRWLAITCLLVIGCAKGAPEMPEHFPVTGAVRYENGEPVAKGLIQFQSVDHPSTNISGTIADGRFTLQTALGNGTMPGVPPGRYQVTITPAFKQIPRSIRLPKTYEVRQEAAQFEFEVRKLAVE